MMNTTHGAIGVFLASVIAFVRPEVAVVAAACAIVGSVIPDLDLFVGTHRRTLHLPVLGWLVVLPALGWMTLSPSAASVGLTSFFLGVATHSAMDALGGGAERRPWQPTSDRGVYAHVPGRWIAPRRWIRYDGAPEDLALAVVAAVPALALYDGGIRALVVAGLVISAVYTAVRKRIPDLTPDRPS